MPHTDEWLQASTPARLSFRRSVRLLWRRVLGTLAIAGLVGSTMAQAAPESYNRLYFESSIALSPSTHTEIERSEQHLVTLDVAVQEIEFGASAYRD